MSRVSACVLCAILAVRCLWGVGCRTLGHRREKVRRRSFYVCPRTSGAVTIDGALDRAECGFHIAGPFADLFLLRELFPEVHRYREGRATLEETLNEIARLAAAFERRMAQLSAREKGVL